MADKEAPDLEGGRREGEIPVPGTKRDTGQGNNRIQTQVFCVGLTTSGTGNVTFLYHIWGEDCTCFVLRV